MIEQGTRAYLSDETETDTMQLSPSTTKTHLLRSKMAKSRGLKR